MDIVTFGGQNQSFGMPGASTLAPWGTMGRSRGTWGLKKGDLGVQAWMTESTLYSDWSCGGKALAF